MNLHLYNCFQDLNVQDMTRDKSYYMFLMPNGLNNINTRCQNLSMRVKISIKCETNLSKSPTDSPSISPTNSPTDSPSTAPSNSPSFSPSYTPTFAPSYLPTSSPTRLPTIKKGLDFEGYVSSKLKFVIFDANLVVHLYDTLSLPKNDPDKQILISNFESIPNC